jgi:outer membrane protein insertion porin family
MRPLVLVMPVIRNWFIAVTSTHPIYKDWVARGYTKLGYGNDLPFYENFYAGGYGSVRGYEASTLGPKSQSYNDAINDSVRFKDEEVGGNALVSFWYRIDFTDAV